MCLLEQVIQELLQKEVGEVAEALRGEWAEALSSYTPPAASIARYAANKTQSMDDLTAVGIYGWTYSTKPYDCPINDTGLMLVLQYATTGNPAHGRLAQIVFSSYGTFTRYRTTTVWSQWQCDTMLQNYDSIKLNALIAKCNQDFIAAAGLDTSSKTTPKLIEGEHYRGIPYSSRHYDSLDVFFNTNLDSLFSMLNHPATAIYHYDKGEGSGAVYTGAVCSSFVSWACNLPIYCTTYDIMKMLNYKTINNIEDIEIGDVLICHTSWGDKDNHVMLVSNIFTDCSGVAAVEIAEMWNPLFRTVVYEKQRFMGLLQGTTRTGESYRVGRFDDHSLRTMPPLEINQVLMTEKGNKVYYELGEDIYITIPKNNKIVLTFNDEVTSYDISNLPKNAAGDLCNIKSLITAVGRWTITNPEETDEKCTIDMIRKGTAALTGGKVTLSGYENCKPCGYAVVGVRKGGSGQYPSYTEDCTATRLTIVNKNVPRYAGKIITDIFAIKDAGIGDPYIGYYVRIFYETAYGQAYQDTNVISVD